MEVRDLNGTISKPSELPLGYDVICERLSEYVSGIRGALLEDKGYSVALHYRQAPDQGLPARAVAEAAVAPFADDYQVLTGNMVLEIKPRGIDKGTAIVDLMKRIHWSQRPPTFAGDDTTDEDGFAVVNKLNGVSIRVGQTDNTCAKYQVASVDELLEWLNRISNAP